MVFNGVFSAAFACYYCRAIMKLHVYRSLRSSATYQRAKFTLFILHSYDHTGQDDESQRSEEVVQAFFHEHAGLLCKKEFAKVSPAAVCRA